MYNELWISNTHINSQTSHNQYYIIDFIIIHMFQNCENVLYLIRIYKYMLFVIPTEFQYGYSIQTTLVTSMSYIFMVCTVLI